MFDRYVFGVQSMLTIHGSYGYGTVYISGQISIIPKPELRGIWGSSLNKPPFGVTSAEVVINCPDSLTL